MAKSYDQFCPIARTLEVIGDRWTLIIIRDLFFDHAKFSELLAQSPRMPTKVLSDRLRLLEEHGIVERAVYREHPLRASYHLTERGRALAPVLQAIVAWGLEHRFEGRERETARAKVNEKVKASSLASTYPMAGAGRSRAR